MLDSIFLFAVAHFLLFFGLVYVSPSSGLRPLVLLSIIICCLVSVRSPFVALVPGGIGGEYVIGFIFHSSHFLCLAELRPSRKWNASAQRSWGLNQIIHARWGIAYIPPFRRDDPGSIPSKRRLFLSRFWDLVWTTTVIYLWMLLPLDTNHADFLDVPNGYLRRLHEIDAREAIIRHYKAIFGYVIPYCTLRGAHSLATCIALSLGDSPERWPPLFGKLEDAYTVRRWFS